MLFLSHVCPSDHDVNNASCIPRSLLVGSPPISTSRSPKCWTRTIIYASITAPTRCRSGGHSCCHPRISAAWCF